MLAFILGSALVSGLIFMPLVRRLSIRLGRIARPRPDRWSARPTATLGGVGICGAFLLCLVFTGLLFPTGGAGVFKAEAGLLAGSVIIFLLGLYDDFRRISPPAKLVGQILAAAVVVFFGYTTRFFSPRLGNDLAAQLLNILLTFTWLVGITNAINLLDNMDGLAGGIALITAGILSYFFWRAGDPSLMTIALALAGSILAFLVFNFPPASIFMGDSGSLFLGFTLAALAIARQPQASNVFAVLGVPTLLFLLPILDTTLVTVTRLMRGQSPAAGGRDHTSHRLIAFGFSERKTILVLYAIALVSGLLAAVLESIQYWFSLILVPALVLSLSLVAAYLGGMKVVEPAGAPERGKPIRRIMLELTYRRRLLEVVLDFLLIGIAFFLALYTVSGFLMDSVRFDLFLQFFPVVVAATYLSFFSFGVYRGVWRYVSAGDLLRFGKATGGAALLVFAADRLLQPEHDIPVSLFVFYWFFLTAGLSATRGSFKILDLLGSQQPRPEEKRVLIYGAGDEGEMALRWILMNPGLEWRPVGFLDRDPFLAGRQIHGVEVLGGLDRLADLLEKKHIEGLILTPQAAGVDAEQLVAACHAHGCWVRSLRLDFELVE